MLLRKSFSAADNEKLVQQRKTDKSNKLLLLVDLHRPLFLLSLIFADL
jgi:hypothetical protein